MARLSVDASLGFRISTTKQQTVITLSAFFEDEADQSFSFLKHEPFFLKELDLPGNIGAVFGGKRLNDVLDPCGFRQMIQDCPSRLSNLVFDG